jgi:tetratricopeptide (TPR) repeat protein
MPARDSKQVSARRSPTATGRVAAGGYYRRRRRLNATAKGAFLVNRYQVAHLEEIEEVHDGRCPFRPVRHHFGLTTFGVNTWTARAVGDRLINDHDESDEFDGDELYLVLSGRARFEIDGDRVDASAGAFVAVAAGINRTAFAEQPDTTLVAIGGGPEGKPYRPLGWEVWSSLEPLFAAGRHEEVLAQAEPLLQAESHYPMVLYNVACSESALGRTEDALGHLRRAVEVMPKLGDYARDDERLAALRGNPAFSHIIGGG